MSIGTGFQPNCPRHPKENLKPEDIRSIRLICVQKFVQFVQFEEGDSQIVFYQPNETISIEVKLDADYDTVWLSINQMAQLFGRDKSVIGKHVRAIFKDGELQKDSVWAKFAYTASDGKTYQVERWRVSR